MAIAGTIERSSTITLPRVLERIFDQEQPGSLRLRHKDSGRTAIVKIDCGAVQETVFGELKGDAAMREISQTFPLEYEFESLETGIPLGRRTDPEMMRARKRPALKLVGAEKPMMVPLGVATCAAADAPSPAAAGVPVCVTAASGVAYKSGARFMQVRERPGSQPLPAPAEPVQAKKRPVREFPSKATINEPAGPPLSPMHRFGNLPAVGSLAEWVSAGDEFAIRFACSSALTLGSIGATEMDYFRSDCASLLERAGLIGDVLGFSPPSLAVIVEPERAAGYRRLADGFAGVYCGPESTVDALLAIL